MTTPASHDDGLGRTFRLRPASSITPRVAHWLWQDRIPLGALSLLAGREGIGKSTLAYDLVAKITRGRLEGRFHGTPRSVIICATEDSARLLGSSRWSRLPTI